MKGVYVQHTALKEAQTYGYGGGGGGVMCTFPIEDACDNDKPMRDD